MNLERCRNEPSQTPAQAAMHAIDTRLADLPRRIRNKHKVAELVDDDERADLAKELTALRAQHRTPEAERAVAVVVIHAANASVCASVLARVIDWAATVGERVNNLTMRQRREIVAAFGAAVSVWRVEDRDPQVTLDLHLPLSGALLVLRELDGSMSVCVITIIGKIQKPAIRR